MNLREAAKQALEAMEVWRELFDGNALPGWRFSVLGEKAITDLRDALYEDAMQRFTDVQQQMERHADTSKTSDHIADANKMVATSQEFRQVEPVAWMRADRGHVDFHRHPDYLPLYTTAPPGIVARAVAVERERVAAWVEDMCVGLDAKTIANGIRNGGNDDIRAFEVRK